MARRVFHGATIISADPATFAALRDGFARDATRAWHDGVAIAGVDATRLRVLDAGYATDGERVVHRARPCAADPASFEIIGTSGGPGWNLAVARDRHTLYIDHHPASGPDRASLELLGGRLLVDRESVWIAHDKRFLPVAADRASLRRLDDDVAADHERAYWRGELLDGARGAHVLARRGYATDGHRVYLYNRHIRDAIGEVVVIDDDNAIIGGVAYCGHVPTDRDAATLVSIGRAFTADARAVYFEGRVLDGADPGTFRVFPRDEASGWAWDGDGVWFRRYRRDDIKGEWIERLDGVDPATFTPIDATYARAGDRILCRTAVAEAADAATFRAHGDHWCADVRHVWHGTQRLAGARAEALAVHGAYAVVDLDEVDLRPLGDGYAAGSAVLYAGVAFDGPDPATARSLGGGYLVDRSGAWSYELVSTRRDLPRYFPQGGRLDGADPATLRRVGPFAVDRARVYARAQSLDAEAAAFRTLGGGYATDGRTAFYEENRLDAAPARLRVLGGYGRQRRLARAAHPVRDAYAVDGLKLFVCGWPLSAGKDARHRARIQALVVGDLALLDAWFATDGRAIVSLYDEEVLEHADVASFEVLGDGYARDLARVWGRHGELKADPSRFRVLGDDYATDGVVAWHAGFRDFELDGALELLGGGWARDDRGVLCGDTRVDADRETFVVVGAQTAAESSWDPRALALDDAWPGPRCGLGRDRNGLRWGPDAATPADAVAVGDGYAIGPATVYFAGAAIDADAASFVLIGGGYARDDHRAYYRGHPTQGT